MRIHFLRRILCAAAVLYSCAYAATPAMAAEQTAAATPPPAAEKPEELDTSGQALKKEILDLLEYEKKVQQTVGDRLETSGEVSVKKMGAYYAVTLPDITFHDARGTSTKIGVININAVPGENNNLWKLSIALPTSFYCFDEKGRPVIKTSLGQQNLKGVWNSTMHHLTSMDGQYGDVTIVNPSTNIGTNIGSVTLKISIAEQADGSWAGPGKFEALQIKSIGENKIFSASIGSITVESTTSGYTAQDAAQLKETISSAGDAAGQAQAQGLSTQPNADLWLKLAKSMGNENSTSFSIKDISFQNLANPEISSQASSFKLADLAFETKFSGLKGGSPSITLGTRYSGLSMTPSGTGVSSLVPASFDLGVEISGLPSVETISAAGKDGLKQTISASQAAIDLKSFKLENKDYTAEFAGSIKNNADLPGKVAGAFTGDITGLSDLVAKVGGLAQTLPQQAQGQAMMAVGMLGMVDSLGVANDPNLPRRKHYDIQLGANGVTVNGKPVGGPSSGVSGASDVSRAQPSAPETTQKPN